MDYYQKALESWYKEGHPLRLDPLHPLLGMAGEAGELLNLYKKNEYKPNFSWWDCKCTHSKKEHVDKEGDMSCVWFFTCPCEKYTPFVLDELGDIWYYMRIIAWQQNIKLESSDEDWTVLKILDLLSELANYSTGLLKWHLDNETIAWSYFFCCYEILLAILLKLDYSLEQLTDLNYAKLNTSDQNGWSSAR